MRRSEVNEAIRNALSTLEKHHITLPPFGYLSAEEWRRLEPAGNRLRTNSMGWDVSDFGEGSFRSYGAVLFTLRNGNSRNPSEGTPYAEKLIVLLPGQRLPLHFHFRKTEDIINRAGGILVMELYAALPDGEVDRVSPVEVWCDGCRRVVEPGKSVEFQVGESITLPPRMYHRFWASAVGETLVCGEVSSINDDLADNRFAEEVRRFALIEEDEPPQWPLTG